MLSELLRLAFLVGCHPFGIVGKSFFQIVSRQLSKSTKRKKFLPMVGGALERGGKEGQDRLLIRNQPTILFSFFFEFPGPTPLKSTFLASVCVSGFSVWDLVGQTRVLHWSSWLAVGGNE